MKAMQSTVRGRLVLIAGLTGALLVAILTIASAKDGDQPAYLATATFKTSAKCKMCHKAEFANWSTSKHSQFAATAPWDVVKPGEKAPDKPVTPAAAIAARYTTGYDPATGAWAEKGIACEACHGPGSAHMGAKKEEKKAVIVDPAELATPAQQASVCGRCHGQYSIGDKRYAANFQPGQNLLEVKDIKLDEVKPGGTMQEFNELVKSKHFAKGVTCTTCHASHINAPQAHQLKKPATELCAGCHKQTIAVHAPQAKDGATCTTCHMADGRHDFTTPAH